MNFGSKKNIGIFVIKKRIARWLRHILASHPPGPVEVGAGTYIDPSVQFLGAQGIRLGRGCNIGEDCWFNCNHADPAQSRIEVRDFSFLGRRNFLNAGRAIIIGEYFLSGPDCHFISSDHCKDDPFTPYVNAGSTVGDIIDVGPNCWFGSSVIVVGNVTIGHGSIVGAGSIVTKDVPPFSLAVGTPARVVRRYCVESRSWVRVDEFAEEKERRLPGREEYLEALKSKHPYLKLPRIACSGALGSK